MDTTTDHITPCSRGVKIKGQLLQGFSGPLSQKSDENRRMREGILNWELRACVDSRRFFVTTDLKNPVSGGHLGPDQKTWVWSANS